MNNGFFFNETCQLFPELKFFYKLLSWVLFNTTNVITAVLETPASNGNRKQKPTSSEIQEKFVWDYLGKSQAISSLPLTDSACHKIEAGR